MLTESEIDCNNIAAMVAAIVVTMVAVSIVLRATSRVPSRFLRLGNLDVVALRSSSKINRLRTANGLQTTTGGMALRF